MLPVTTGIEVEYIGSTDRLARRLAEAGWCNPDKHDYHCTCQICNYNSGCGALWRYQHDSTVSGEFVTRILHDWATANLAIEMIADLASALEREGRLTTSQSTGLHIHLGYDGLKPNIDAFRDFLFYERYIQRLGSGPFPDKRAGMNMTALDAYRQETGRGRGERVWWSDMGQSVIDSTQQDRHVDINWSRRLRTVEYRVFNSTTEAWQMRLDLMLALFIHTTHELPVYDSDQIVLPPDAARTLRPPCSFDDFCQLFVDEWPDAEELVNRHRERHGLEDIPSQPHDLIEASPDDEPEEGDFPFMPVATGRRPRTTTSSPTPPGVDWTGRRLSDALEILTEERAPQPEPLVGAALSSISWMPVDDHWEGTTSDGRFTSTVSRIASTDTWIGRLFDHRVTPNLIWATSAMTPEEAMTRVDDRWSRVYGWQYA